MTDRRDAWITHAIFTVLLFTGVTVWAMALVRGDQHGWHIGEAIAIICCGAAVTYALLATIAVALWGRRPLAVLALHVASLTLTGLLLVGFSAG